MVPTTCPAPAAHTPAKLLHFHPPHDGNVPWSQRYHLLSVAHTCLLLTDLSAVSRGLAMGRCGLCPGKLPSEDRD